MAGKERYTTGEVIAALKAARGIKAQAAQLLKCDRTTVDNYIKRHPTVRRAFEEQRETLVDLAEHRLTQRLDAGEWPAIRFVLSTLGRHRGYVPGTDVTSGDRPLAGGFCIIEVAADDEGDEE